VLADALQRVECNPIRRHGLSSSEFTGGHSFLALLLCTPHAPIRPAVVPFGAMSGPKRSNERVAGVTVGVEA